MPLLRLLLLLLLLLNTHPAHSQKNVDSQHLLWLRYNLRVPLNETHALRQEVEERTYWFPWRQHQLISRTVVERKLGKGWNAGLGLTAFRQSLPHDPLVPVASVRNELRPMVEIAGYQAFSEKVGLHHRYWGELRYFEAPEGGFAFSNYRFRYRAELRYLPTTKLQVRAFEEILLNAGKQIALNVFDQNRYGASVQYFPTKRVGFELGYLNWFQQRPSGQEFYDRHIVRFTVHHQLPQKGA
ncbi:hypothetical protein GGR28_003479 [Lewinella aquimaris]|uniref:DUF2490 domain-containing protein n=1 Tax=Neolewinella aquimaris TaxID=1835722 RepID=A0A840E727_9BACT|nr:DUF2490 domain-containing protein [Neolewinella aquimaris]MBB4080840.1 hypothetical protein [Neolewinella aquimaris]